MDKGDYFMLFLFSIFVVIVSIGGINNADSNMIVGIISPITFIVAVTLAVCSFGKIFFKERMAR